MSHRVADERGFAMPAVLLITFVCGLLAVAALNGVIGDLPSARADQDRRQALDAAQAGVAWYASMLEADPSYWSKCGSVPAINGQPAPVAATPVADGATNADSARPWRSVSGSTAQYTVELLPAPGYASCSTTNAGKSMLVNGALRIRVTGRVSPSATRKRSLIATFRKAGFMNYVYYTKFETQDPTSDDDPSTTGDATSCGQPLLVFDQNGQPVSGQGAAYKGCGLISWATNDAVKGPFHTEDTPIGCGNPVFGRASQVPKDRMEVHQPSGYYDTCGSSGPTYNGDYVKGAGSVDLPPNNASLQSIAAQSGVVLTGRSSITLKTGGSFSWTQNGTTKDVAYPANGLIYVQAGAGACTPYSSTNVTSYNDTSSSSGTDYPCGTVDVKGTYDRDLTIASANDIIVRGNITRAASSTTAMLGLVANDFVRVYHPVTTPINFKDSRGNLSSTDPDGTRSCQSSNNYPSAADKVTTIQAGILAVGHSFIVDNFRCGAQLGTLTVTGAIAQKWRGPVAKANTSGYTKNYVYNDDFAYREPPNFLDPVQSAWVLVRQNEQFPAT